MDFQQYKEKKRILESEYFRILRDSKTEYEKKLLDLEKKYTRRNSKYHKGDFVKCNDGYIFKIDYIKFIGESGPDDFMYSGPAYTTRFIPRKMDPLYYGAHSSTIIKKMK